MAVVLDINMISLEWMDLESAIYNAYNCHNVNITIDEIIAIDDWSWSKFSNVMYEDMYGAVSKGKVVCVKMHSDECENMGVFIQKIDNNYNYTIWLSMEKHPEMDTDEISERNYNYYIQVINHIKRTIIKKESEFIVIAVGVETVFKYNQRVEEVVKSSKNVVLWIINHNIVNETIFLSDYIEIFKHNEVIIFGKVSKNVEKSFGDDYSSTF